VVFEWHSHFKAGRVSLEYDKCSEWPSTSKMTEKLKKSWELVHKDHRWTIHELADTFGISYGVCQEILTENLKMRHIVAKFDLQLLTNDQKQQRINVCPQLWEKANEDPTFTNISRIITGDESWICSYDPETKQQSSQWKNPQSPRAKKKKARQVQSLTKSMLIFFWHDRDCSLWNYSA
jgi:hypothetical protein